MAKYKASYIKLAPSPQRLKQEKGKSREGEKRKRGSSQLVKTEEKENALFSVPWEESPLAEDFETDIFSILRLETVDCEILHLFTSKTDKACLRASPLQGKLLRPGRRGDCLGLLHLRVNLQLRQHLSTNGLFGTSYVFTLNLAL